MTRQRYGDDDDRNVRYHGDGRGPLRDGERLRTPLHMMDAMQRDVARQEEPGGRSAAKLLTRTRPGAWRRTSPSCRSCCARIDLWRADKVPGNRRHTR
jgi:hypothetical protein